VDSLFLISSTYGGRSESQLAIGFDLAAFCLLPSAN